VEQRKRDFNKPQQNRDRPQPPQHDLVHSSKVRAGKRRTYFFDVRRTPADDHYLTITESTKKFNGSYERHKVFLYKEDFNRFMKELDGVISHIKTELMPEYDYEEFEKRQLEWEERRANGEFDIANEEIEEEDFRSENRKDSTKESDDDMSW
jgi:Protein of unknown function (DUF3276)